MSQTPQASAIDTGRREDAGNLARVIVTTIGTARPSAAAAVSKGLGVPADRVIGCLYRAPAVLVDGIERELATRLSTLLSEIGLGVRVDPDSAPLPDPEPPFDIALYVRDARQIVSVADWLATFLGCPADQALDLIVTPPGLVLGGVSPATVKSLREQLPGEAVELVASRADTAIYDLFSAGASPVVLDALRRDLAARGIEVLDVGGLIASGLDFQTGTLLWRRHQASGAIRLVNQEFQRFDLMLDGTLEGPPAAVQIEALGTLAGVPLEMADTVFQNLPITLEEGVPHADLPVRLQAYAEAGLAVSAQLTTFQHVGVEILECEDAAATASALAEFGLLEAGTSLPALPYSPQAVLPELQARMLRAALEPLGARLAFVDALP